MDEPTAGSTESNAADGVTIFGYEWPHGPRTFTRTSDGGAGFEVLNAAGEPVLDVRSQVDMLGARWGITPTATGFRVVTAGADAASWNEVRATYADAVALIGEQLAQGDPRPVLDQRWRSDMAFEGVSTGDGRFIDPGATTFRSPPMPLMLQTVTEGGHDGAVLAGTIEQTGMLGQTVVGAGSFDDSPAGRQFVDIINARGRFGVSIDVAEADGGPVCGAHGDDLADCGPDCDIEMHFSMIRIMGVTGTPFPAFADAFVELAPAGGAVAPLPVAAAGSKCETCSGKGTIRGGKVACPDCKPEAAVKASCACQEPVAASSVSFVRPTASNVASVVTTTFANNTIAVGMTNGVQWSGPAGAELTALQASAGPAIPPAAWFEDPGFKPGDDRLVRQPDGNYVCPMTVLPDGRIFGHFAGKYSCHTGFSDRCITMPHSQSNYAAFHLRPIETDQGEILGGHITMGCGHAPTTGGWSPAQVRDHYDGGPGALLAARVRCGEDEFGGWFAGALCPDLTDEQVRRFKSLSVSGDWREVWRGKGLELLACLAGVPSPGFPVAAMAAAGFVPVDPDTADILPEASSSINDDGQTVALVASGVVRQPLPWERALAHQQEQIEALERKVTQIGHVADRMRPLAAQLLQGDLSVAASNGAQ